MGKSNNQHELRNSCAEVLREVEAGDTVVVTRNGKPAAELRPMRLRHFAPRAAIARAAERAACIHATGFWADLDNVTDPSVDG